jgi:NADPH-dependent 2,4-dienoyl-CoA reductase/sulfur reductase-like enzyme
MSDNNTINSSSGSIPSGGFKGSDLPPLVTDEPPKVLIAGAGLAGLVLGIYLEEAGIPYEIFERTAEIKPLGM